MRISLRFFAALALLLGAMAAYAVHALRMPRMLAQPDGSMVTLTLAGDEYYSFYLTDDGRVALPGADGGYYYAEVDPASGMPRPSGALVAEVTAPAKAQARLGSGQDAMRQAIAKARSESPRLMARRAPLGNAPQRAEQANTTSYTGKGLLSDRALMTVTGSPRVLVILVEYSDYAFETEGAYDYFNGMLNTPGFSQYGATGSARDYFSDASGGQFTPAFDVYGPVTLPHERKYYGEPVSQSIPDRDDAQMIVDAIEMLDAEVDFSVYDNDRDGYIDNVFVIFAGLGQSNGGGEDAVFPNSFNIEYGGKSLTVDGKKVGNYGCTCELRPLTSGGIAPDGIGTFCHEFSHVLGLPDEYDISYDEAWHHAITPGPFSIMDQGNYNNEGRTPPTYSLFERNALGWANIIEITPEANRSLRLGNLIDTNLGLLLGAGSPYNEFFLFENRQNTPGTWDEFLPARGMLVWHINYNAYAWDHSGPNSDADLQRIDIVEACDMADFMSSFIMSQYSYPGPLGKSAITPTTTPALTWADGNVSTISITEIKENPFSGSITLKINDGNAALVYAPTPSVDGHEVKATPYRAKNGYDLVFAAGNEADAVNYIYRGLDGETISSGVCDGSVHINAPGSIEYWASRGEMHSEHCRLGLAFTAADVAISPAGGSFAAMPEVTLTTATTDPAASIYYTTDGTAPSAANGALYEGPFTLAGECTLKAIAINDGWEPSAVTEATFLLASSGIKVEAPVFDPEPGAVADKTCVTATCATEGAVIRYTTDGAEPTEASAVFPADGMTLRADVSIKARAFKEDCESSELVVASYTILPGTGSFKLMTDPAVLAPGAQIIIAARDAEVAMSHSATDNTNNPGIAPAPIEKLGKTVEPDENVLIITLEATDTDGQYLLRADGDLYVAAISSAVNSLGFRTLDEAGANAAATFEIREGTTYVTTCGNYERNNIRRDRSLGFVACSAGSSKPVVEVYYRIPLAAPIFSHEPGYIHSTDMLMITAPMEGAEVRYTDDGTEPDEESSLFPAEGLAITEPTTIKAKAYLNGYYPSPTATASYQVIDDDVAYRLLEDPDQLREGDSLIFTNLDATMAMSVTGADKNYRSGTPIVRQGDSVIPTKSVQIVKLETATELMEGTAAPQWRFNAGENLYLYAASSVYNELMTGALDVAGYNANATISITDGVATVRFQGPNTRNQLGVNTSATRFNSFTIEHTPDIAIYCRHAAPVESGGIDDTTGIESIAAPSASPIYYTLQGTRIARPQAGTIYIILHPDGRVTKEVVK